VRELRGSIWNDHLRKTQAIEYRSYFAVVVVGDCGNGDTFSVGERNMHRPLLPGEHMSVHLEADALWLNDMQRLDILSRLVIVLLRL
jgi:hypothetical protein